MYYCQGCQKSRTSSDSDTSTVLSNYFEFNFKDFATRVFAQFNELNTKIELIGNRTSDINESISDHHAIINELEREISLIANKLSSLHNKSSVHVPSSAESNLNCIPSSPNHICTFLPPMNLQHLHLNLIHVSPHLPLPVTILPHPVFLLPRPNLTFPPSSSPTSSSPSFVPTSSTSASNPSSQPPQPTSPRTLEELSLPADYTHSSSGETLLLWDSSYTTELRHSFLFVTPTNTRTLLETGHLIIGAFPQLFTFKKLQMIIQKFDSYYNTGLSKMYQRFNVNLLSIYYV